MRSSAFFWCFMSNSGAYTEHRTKPFISSTGVDYFNYVKQLLIIKQELSDTKYSFLFTCFQDLA